MADTTSSVILGLDVKEFRRGITQVDSSLKQMSRQFSDLGGLIGASFAGAKLQEFVMQSIDLGLQAEGIARAFERIGNEANLAQMRQQVKGTVNDLNLMQQAVKAENLGIPIQNFTKYLGFAKKQAQEMGTSVDFMVESIVNGVGRQSSLILDNLGISATQLNEELKKGGTYADAVGRIIDQSMAAAGDQVLTTKDKIDAQRASIENLQMAIGQNLLPVYEGMLQFVSTGMQLLNNLLSDHLTFWQKLAYIASYAMGAAGAETRIYLDALEASNKTLNDVTLEAPKMGQGLVAASTEATAAVKKTTDGYRDLLDIVGQLEATQRQLRKATAGEMERITREEIGTGFVPIDIEEVDMLEGELVPLIDRINATGDSIRAAAAVGAEFGQILSQAFTASITNGENFFEVLRKAIMDYVKQMAVALATTTALAAVFSAVTGGGFGAAFGAIAQGTGLGNLFGDSGVLNLSATLKGPDIKLATDRNNVNFGRIGG